MADIVIISLDDPVDASINTINNNFSAINSELGNHSHSPSQITDGGASSGQLLRWGGSAWAPASGITVDASGKLGIGASSPSHPLHITVSSDSVGLRLDRDGSARAFLAQDALGGYCSLYDSSGGAKLTLHGGYFSRIPNRLGINLPDGSWPDHHVHVYDNANGTTNLWLENDSQISGNISQVRVYAFSGSNACLGGYLVGGAHRGTKAEPQPIQTGDVMLRLVGVGQQTTSPGAAGGGAMVEVISAGTWSSTNRYSHISFRANGPSQAAFPPAERLRIEGEGALAIQPAMQTPSSPAVSSEGKIYIRNGKLVIQYNDAGTVRYKYLNLAGTGVTWVHTTTAP